MDVDLEDNGKDRKLIAGPVPGDPASSVPMDSSLFSKTLFESAITKRDVAAVAAAAAGTVLLALIEGNPGGCPQRW